VVGTSSERIVSPRLHTTVLRNGRFLHAPDFCSWRNRSCFSILKSCESVRYSTINIEIFTVIQHFASASGGLVPPDPLLGFCRIPYQAFALDPTGGELFVPTDRLTQSPLANSCIYCYGERHMRHSPMSQLSAGPCRLEYRLEPPLSPPLSPCICGGGTDTGIKYVKGSVQNTNRIYRCISRFKRNICSSYT